MSKQFVLATIVTTDEPRALCPDCGTECRRALGHTPYAQKCPACGIVLDVSPAGFADPENPNAGIRYEVRHMDWQANPHPFDPSHSASYPPG